MKDEAIETENDIQEYILERLSYIKNSAFWLNPQAGYFNAKAGRFVKHKSEFIKKGVSDILGFHNERFCAFEVKTVKDHKYIKKHGDVLYSSDPILLNKPKAHIWRQRDFIEIVIRHGGIGGFVSSFEDCEELLGIKY